VIFYSYVSLPEGNHHIPPFFLALLDPFVGNARFSDTPAFCLLIGAQKTGQHHPSLMTCTFFVSHGKDQDRKNMEKSSLVFSP